MERQRPCFPPPAALIVAGIPPPGIAPLPLPDAPHPMASHPMASHPIPMQDVFMAVVALWQRLVCGHAGRALALARQPEVLSKLEGVARLLSLKLEGDKKYLTKLEQQKGSDVSARQATKALLASQRQLRALRAVLAATGASREAGGGGGAEEELQLGKNTLVRAVLKEHK